MKIKIKQCLFILFLGLGCFPQKAIGRLELTLSGGMHINPDLKLEEINEISQSSNQNAWILGGDLLYRLPAINFGFGIRYQKMCLKNPDTATDVNWPPRDLCADRFAVLGSYRLKFLGFFIGPFVALDLFKALSLQAQFNTSDVTTFGPSDDREWSLGTGQLALEIGFQWSNFFVRSELGYSLFSFKELCKEDIRCIYHANQSQLKLSGPYVLVGAGLALF